MTKLAVHESATSDKVVAFIEIDSLPETIQALNENGSLYGLYYDESGDIKAKDIWDMVHNANPCAVTFDIVFNDENSSNNKGFKFSTLREALEYINGYNGSNHSYFEDYKGETVAVVCNETGERVFETEVL